MTDENTTERRFATIVLVTTVVLGTGMIVSLAGGSALFAEHETGEQAAHEQKTVTAEGLAADQVQLENVTIRNMTVDIAQYREEGPEAVVEDSIGESTDGTVEGFAVESVEVGEITSADITVENDVATIDVEIASVTLEGLSADRVTMGPDAGHAAQGQSSEPASDARTQSEAVASMMSGMGLDADRIVVEDVSIDRVVIEQVDSDTAETPAETPGDDETETPSETPTQTPTETPTDTPVDDETETPTQTPTETPTETPADNETDDGTELPVFEPPTDNETETPTDNEPMDDVPTASVQFSDQTSNGTVVTVDEVNTSEGGFIAIHDDTLLDGNVVGSVVGVTEYLENGTHEDVNATLFDVPGAEFNQTELDEDQTLIAMPHLDSNDNETYDFVAVSDEADGPYTEDGEAVVDTANVTIETDATTGNESATVAN